MELHVGIVTRVVGVYYGVPVAQMSQAYSMSNLVCGYPQKIDSRVGIVGPIFAFIKAESTILRVPRMRQDTSASVKWFWACTLHAGTRVTPTHKAKDKRISFS